MNGPHLFGDSATMTRRSLRRMIRYPALTGFVIGTPVVFLLLFVHVFGGTLGAGLGAVPGAVAGAGGYIDYLTPGILLLTVTSAAQGIAVSVALDRTEGIMDRFRTMAVARSAVLTGHVLAGVIQAVLATVVVALVAVLVGFRPTAGPLGWLAGIGLCALAAFALTWLCIALGLVSRSVETASNWPMILALLPLLGSGFVPTASMPAWLRLFAENQPYTPIIETLRALLRGTPPGGTGWLALGWCVALTLVGFLWSMRLFHRQPTR